MQPNFDFFLMLSNNITLLIPINPVKYASQSFITWTTTKQIPPLICI